MTGTKPIQSEVGPSCPASRDWALLAAGQISGERAQQLLAHAAGCEDCGLTLRLAAEAVSDDDPVVEMPAPAPDLARRLAGSSPAAARPVVVAMPARPAPSLLRRRWPLMAAIAAGLVLAAGWMLRLPQAVSGEAAETLLAQAYTERRPFEFRVGDAAYAPVRVKRSSAAARPAALAQAESQIQESLAADPQSVHALQLRARAQMLEFEPQAAIATLRRALAVQPKNAALLADLGSAQAQAGDWAQAHEALTAALMIQPGLAAAVFNRALVNEKREALGEAMADWERFLTLDGASGWAKEAREHRAALERAAN